MKKFIIALDGPAGSGKSTIAKKIAKIFKLTYLDTGAMYRMVTLYMLENKIDIKNESLVKQILNTIHLDIDNDRFILNGKDVSKEIRTPQVTSFVSEISAIKSVRIKLVELQRAISLGKSVILDGRDIGTVVFPNANLKIFLTASPEQRAKRRVKDYASKGISEDYDSVLNEILRRDELDSTRKESPLKKASDAIIVDTSFLNIDETISVIQKLIVEYQRDISLFYNILRIVLYPFLLIYLIFHPKDIKQYLAMQFQNLTILKKDCNYIWIHCSSVGEINLLDGLITQLEKKFDENILITVFTKTGYQNAQKKYFSNNKISVLRFPLDNLYIIRKIFKYINVTKLLVVETEIWPNLLIEGAKYSKIYIVNGRISKKSFPKYKRFSYFLKAIFPKINSFFMQSEDDSKRIIELGANPSKVFTIGNLKFDISFENFSEFEKNRLKEQINSISKKIFVAGSTRDGEEQIIIDVFKSLKNTTLVIVPRHLNRLKEIEQLLTINNLSYQLYSNINNNLKNYDVVLVDKMGILRKFYSIADISFVGGTFVNIGGHNLLEPLYYGIPPIFGPYLQNVKEVSTNILKSNLGYKVSNKTEFLNAIEQINNRAIVNNEINLFFENNNNIATKIIDLMEEK